MPNNFLTLNGTISGSLSLSDGLELGDNPINIGQVSILPSGNIGDLVVSGSNLYFYNGSDWMEMYGTSITTPTPTPTPEPEPTPTPRPPVDFTINISNSPYNVLQNVGGSYTNSENNVIIAKTSTDTFVALDSQCTHSGVSLDYQPLNNRFYCPGHGCMFNTTGSVLNGPASVPLKTYTTFLSGSLLRVYENNSITPTPTPSGPTNDPIVFTIDIEPSGNDIYPVLGSSQYIVINITSIIPSSGVTIDVNVKKDLDNSTVYSSSMSSSTSNNPITITGLPSGVVCTLTVTITSINGGGNSAIKQFKIARM